MYQTIRTLLILAATIAFSLPTSDASASESALQHAPKNPHLADSWNPIAHVDVAQTDTFWHPFPVPPKGTSRRLQADELKYSHYGIGNFGAMSSAPYPDGSFVIWSNGRHSIRKEDPLTGEVLAEYFLPGIEPFSEEKSDALNEFWDKKGTGIRAILKTIEPLKEIASLSYIYTLIDPENNYLVVDSRKGQVVAFADATKGDPRSDIVVAKTYDFPEELKGAQTVGFNMTFDGWLVLATYDGRIFLLKRDFSEHRIVRLNHSIEEDAANFEGGPIGYGWVRNAPVIDSNNSIYVLSYQHLHKVIWNGDQLSVNESDGAWTVTYEGGRAGSGSTPTLMGFGPDEDRMIAFTDGQDVMHLMLAWRDEVPDDWEGLPGLPRRVAGIVKGDMGDPNIEHVQSEQSVSTFGYGVFIVNNYPKSVPWWLPDWGHQIITNYLANHVKYQPQGIMKAEWNPESRDFYKDWAHPRVSSPNMVPTVLGAHNMVMIHSANEDSEFVSRAFDWDTGVQQFEWIVGGTQFNCMYSMYMYDYYGNIWCPTHFGRLIISPKHDGQEKTFPSAMKAYLRENNPKALEYFEAHSQWK
jgi:hypothetical protein